MFVAALVAAFFVPAVATSQPTDKESPSCERAFRAGEYRQFARKAYRLKSMAPHVHYRLLHMRQCAIHREALKAMHRTTLRQRRLRIERRLRNCGTPTCNRRLGEYLTLRRYGTAGWNCLAPIIDQESGWDHDVWNTAGSGAYGIPQALPASKMASAGADYMTNPRTQIRWLFGYVDGRYGGPCGALSHKHATGWY